MLGADLCPIFRQEHEVIAVDLKEMDVRDPDATVRTARKIAPDLIVHLAALTDVDECERNPDAAYLSNAIGTRNVALACQETGAVMAYISTIAVFDGQKPEPYNEFDAPNPQSIYSRSKFEGEAFVRSLLNRYYVIRAGWMFGGQALDKKFVAKILALAQERPQLKVVDDKFGSPTYTRDMAAAIHTLTSTGYYGTYHLVGTGEPCSRLEFARAILACAGITTCQIEPVNSASFPLAAPRPRMEAARNHHTELLGMRLMRPWREALCEYVTELMRQAAYGDAHR
jgi:dTDP-4-dehydrorhamnose reductase